jgi:prophage regulatory protein
MDSPPESTGRVLLATGFSHYCILQFGFSAEEIADALSGGGEPEVRERVIFSAKLLGSVLAHGSVKAWARPFGGGDPIPLLPNVWELDDFGARFATSAIDPKLPFDRSCKTHWIFVDLHDWNEVLEASIAGYADRPRATAKATAGATAAKTPPVSTATIPADADRLIRMPEVKHRTGVSRSTIHRWMDQGRFPRSLLLGGNIAVWRESDVVAWIANSA